MLNKSKLDWFSRISLSIVYIWFGLLKVIGESPAEGLVVELQQKTISFIDGEAFVILLGLFEIAVGVLFLIRKYTKYTVIVFLAHMFTTFLPMVLLTSVTWQSGIALTLEGQYIVKNIVLIALALNIYKNS